MTCKNCYHYSVCSQAYFNKICKKFKDKKQIKELPFGALSTSGGVTNFDVLRRLSFNEMVNFLSQYITCENCIYREPPKSQNPSGCKENYNCKNAIRKYLNMEANYEPNSHEFSKPNETKESNA